MKTPLIALFMTFLTFSVRSQDKKICVTIDDVIGVTYGNSEDSFLEYINTRIVDVCTQNGVPAIGYVNEDKLYVKGQLAPFRVRLLDYWLSSGMDIGNHTFSHLNYDKVELDRYVKNIKRGSIISDSLASIHNKTVRHFRYPYLRHGNTKLRSDTLKSVLAQLGLVPAPVTIDNEEYLFAKAYTLAYNEGDSVVMNKIGDAYIQYMEQKLHYFEAKSQEVLGRNIHQTLLIHCNQLNADYLDRLIQMFKNNGYQFISQEEVLKDSAYQYPNSWYGKWGISWIHRCAMSQGITPEDAFKGDPEVPEFVREY